MLIILKADETPLLKVTGDGKVKVLDLSLDSASRVFWESVGRKYSEYDLLFKHMETLLSHIGSLDLQQEVLSQDLEDSNLPERSKEPVEELYNANSEKLSEFFSAVVSLGRALAKRGLPLRPLPNEIPQCVKDDEASDYTYHDVTPGVLN